MRIVSSKASKREHTAIVKYANQTDESVSNLIRTVLINEAICTYGFDNIPKDYHVNRYPVDMEGKDEDNILVEKINTVRRRLGWKKLDNNGKPKKEDNS